MASKSEVGHAKNVANLNLLNTHITALGTRYNPTNASIKLIALQAMYEMANSGQLSVNDLTGAYALAINDREIEFESLSRNLTRLRKAYKVTEGVTKAQMDDLLSIIRKLTGKRNPESKTSGEPQSKHSVSQMSYDQRTNNLGLLISLLQNTPNFAPNEAEYNVAYYIDKKAQMLLRTQSVANTYVALNSARSNRNHILYLAPDNMVDGAQMAKDYCMTILPKNSAEYKAIAAIKFKKQYH